MSAGGAGADTGETRDLISQPTVPLRQVGGLFSLPISASLAVITELSWLLLTRRALGTVPQTPALSRKVRLCEDNASAVSLRVGARLTTPALADHDTRHLTHYTPAFVTPDRTRTMPAG